MVGHTLSWRVAKAGTSCYYEAMKRIAVIALKGGVGKTSVVGGLGLALADKGYKVGFVDLDVTGSNLYSALGLTESPKWELDTLNKKVVVPEVNGFWLLSIASYTGEEYAVLWERSHHVELTGARDRIQGIKKSVEKLTRFSPRASGGSSVNSFLTMW